MAKCFSQGSTLARAPEEVVGEDAQQLDQMFQEVRATVEEGATNLAVKDKAAHGGGRVPGETKEKDPNQDLIDSIRKKHGEWERKKADFIATARKSMTTFLNQLLEIR